MDQLDTFNALCRLPIDDMIKLWECSELFVSGNISEITKLFANNGWTIDDYSNAYASRQQEINV